MKIVEFEHVYKEYIVGSNVIKANSDLNFSINKGEFCVIVGPSGSGKTTLLNLLGGMDSITKGSIVVDVIWYYNYLWKISGLYPFAL